MAPVRFSIVFEHLDPYQLAAVLTAARSANVPARLSTEARAALASVPGVDPRPVHTETPARATVATLPGA